MNFGTFLKNEDKRVVCHQHKSTQRTIKYPYYFYRYWLKTV